MAKVKIQGHASGTGILTVTAPNTSTDRTITLPDATDTLAVNSDVTNKLPLAGGNLTGNLGIGETSPATSIHITSSTPKIRLEHTNDNGYSEIYGNTQSGIILDADPGNTDNGTPIVFKTDGTERMRVLDSGGLTFNGEDTAANALDDYEEGTHTATLIMGSGTAALQTNQLAYTKVGRVVHISGQVRVGSVSSPDGSMQISLPFTCLSGNTGLSAGNYRTYNVDTPNDGTNAVISTDAGTAKANFEWSRDGATVTNDRATENGYFLIGLTYMTA